LPSGCRRLRRAAGAAAGALAPAVAALAAAAASAAVTEVFGAADALLETLLRGCAGAPRVEAVARLCCVVDRCVCACAWRESLRDDGTSLQQPSAP
jgi:hypothetical protein